MKVVAGQIYSQRGGDKTSKNVLVPVLLAIVVDGILADDIMY